MRARAFFAAAALAAVSAPAVRAQQPAFRATTELVVVDVSVVGKDGTPVRGLQEPDFAVSIDGKPRKVRTLHFIDQSAPQGAVEERPLRAVSSNAPGAAGRLVLILVDEGSIGFGALPAAAQSIERLLAGFGPADKIGLAGLPNPRMLVDFTADRAAIATAVKRIPG
ncbi:MAG: hypothetical protein H6Q10_2142, partial [Acidobacteria bacterium]|nr:hypothetical protein [Acidobacteriota bacterium]